MDKQKAEEALLAATPESPEVKINIDLTNGILRSSKEMSLCGYVESDPLNLNERRYTIFHSIDGTITEFDHWQAIEVLMGERSPWDGEVQPDPGEMAAEFLDKVVEDLVERNASFKRVWEFLDDDGREEFLEGLEEHIIELM